MNSRKGFSTLGVALGVVVLVVVVGGVLSLRSEKDELETMEGKNDVVVEKKDDSMMGGSSTEVTQKGDSMMKEDGGAMMVKFTGTVLAGKASPLLDFTEADYDAALKSGKLVLLYFYANWCPICKAEVSSALYPAFDELSTDRVIGFRVNYNDNQTDEDERALAKQFGVAYQHTKVFVKDGKQVLKSPEGWSKSRYLAETSKY